MSLMIRLLPENPVLTREMRVRMRGARAYWILLGYLGFLTTVMLFTYHGWEGEVLATGAGASDSSETGKNIYNILLICQTFLVLFITPAITSGSITIEKEQQTLDMLTMTRLSRASMVGGKLISAVSFTALLLISSLPLVSICFMLGGVDPAMVISTYIAMLMGSFFIGAVGLVWSSIARTTTIAVLLTYLTMLGFTVVMYLAIGLYAATRGNPMMVGGGNIGAMALLAVAESWCAPDFLGAKGIEYFGFGILSLLGGLLLASIAMARLETWPDRRAGLLRGLTALIVLLQVGSCCVWWLSRLYGARGLGVANAPAIGALTIPVFILAFMIPVFATGEIHALEARKFGKYLLWGWTPKGLVRGKLASGIPFLAILTLLCLAVYAGAFVGFGKVHDLVHSASLPGAVSTATPTPPAPAPAVPSGYTGTINSGSGTLTYQNGIVVAVNGRPVANSTPVSPAVPAARATRAHTNFLDNSGDFPETAILMLTFVIGFGLLCQFLSIAHGSRWPALAISYLVLFVILVLPLLSVAVGSDANPWFTVNLAYLNPFFAFAEMTDSTTSGFSQWASQHLLLGGFPLWLATSVLWTLVGSISFIASLPFVAKRAMTSKEIPYEEMVVSV